MGMSRWFCDLKVSPAAIMTSPSHIISWPIKDIRPDSVPSALKLDPIPTHGDQFHFRPSTQHMINWSPCWMVFIDKWHANLPIICFIAAYVIWLMWLLKLFSCKSDTQWVSAFHPALSVNSLFRPVETSAILRSWLMKRQSSPLTVINEFCIVL